ncbi:MAG: hypothetical protein GY711_22790 [bacterium]|nr:hypothetical protein [bacterium]
MAWRRTVFLSAVPVDIGNELASMGKRLGWLVEPLRGNGLPLNQGIWAGARCWVTSLSRVSSAKVSSLTEVGCSTVLLTEHHAVSAAVEALQAGAASVLRTPVPPESLEEAVVQALEQSSRSVSQRAEVGVLRRRVSTLSVGERSELIAMFEGRGRDVGRRRVELLDQLGVGSAGMLECLIDLVLEVHDGKRGPPGQRTVPGSSTAEPAIAGQRLPKER